MIQVSVVIPYYQRDGGILRKALASLLAQKLPADVRVTAVVVDDASPAPIGPELEGLEFSGAFALKVVTQANGGVARARNAALDAMPKDTTYVAFLDSDDTWYEGHLAQSIAALEAGYDFYFCDNAREGHHDSHFAGGHGLILPYIDKAPDKEALIPLSREAIATLVLRDFPCQISTTLYRLSVAPQLRFETSVRNAGEDVLFFLHLVALAKRVCFSNRCMVQCGKGINLYFSNMGWECEGYFKRLLDDTRAHELLQRSGLLQLDDNAWNRRYIRAHWQQIVFFSLRYLAKHRRFPEELGALSRNDKRLWLLFALWSPYVMLGRAAGFYKPF